MSRVGSFGAVVFQASPDLVRTFDEMTRTTAGRWANHEILGKKPKSQYIGPGLDQISFTMYFNALLGVNPRKEIDKLVEYDRSGKVSSLIVGGKKLGVGLWKITGMTQNLLTFDNKGTLLTASVSLTLEEYVK